MGRGGRLTAVLVIVAGLVTAPEARADANAGGEPRTEARPTRGTCEPSRPESIVRLGTHAWALDRELVAWFARHPNEVGRLVWVRRERGPDGGSVGYLLGGIRCGSELHLAGLRNGDVLRAINGRPIRSLPEALLTYLSLRRVEVLEVEVVRASGDVEVLTYTLS